MLPVSRCQARRRRSRWPSPRTTTYSLTSTRKGGSSLARCVGKQARRIVRFSIALCCCRGGCHFREFRLNSFDFRADAPVHLLCCGFDAVNFRARTIIGKPCAKPYVNEERNMSPVRCEYPLCVCLCVCVRIACLPATRCLFSVRHQMVRCCCVFLLCPAMRQNLSVQQQQTQPNNNARHASIHASHILHRYRSKRNSITILCSLTTCGLSRDAQWGTGRLPLLSR